MPHFIPFSIPQSLVAPNSIILQTWRLEEFRETRTVKASWAAGEGCVSMATAAHTAVLEEVVGACRQAQCVGPVCWPRAVCAAHMLTFVLWGEPLHGQRQGFIEPLLLGDEGLAYGVFIILHHTQVPPDLMQEGLQLHTHPGVPSICTILHNHGLR